MKQLTLKNVIVLLVFLFVAWLGYLLGDYRHPVSEVVTALPAVQQSDGSVIAARSPVAKPSSAPHVLPTGSREERRIAVTVKPKPSANQASVLDCPPVTVDLSLVQSGDGRRIVASSQDGEVVSAIDMPLEASYIPPPAKVWAVGVSYSSDREKGIWLERDLSRVRLGVDLAQSLSGKNTARVRAGWVF
ncbi:hypothetical protein HQN60_15510 [Deefgea piscis]|uniref:Uncharacterized protein n=1 Tax=Deefgea piscis TaxID=2739061 RepID=A0A6M8SV47_9NEIS|nr:hypothetical protein [Deefgea piscis]QKJ68014.1 hypothetical protein HQN60_15510 [Deefgea piscis]